MGHKMTTQVQMTTVFLLMVVQSSAKLLTKIVWMVKLGKINDFGIYLAGEDTLWGMVVVTKSVVTILVSPGLAKLYPTY